jgi:hypothetical protein
MKPSALRTGMTVRRKDNPSAPVLTFVARSAHARVSTLQSDAYRGLDGPDDEGHVHVSDWDMSRKYERVFARVAV